ncbi:MAG: helix-turn-helix transcriptional regulator [Acinetobacter sp.]
MNLSDSIDSDDYFFAVGISHLLTPDLINDCYYIVDWMTKNIKYTQGGASVEKKIVVFISSDLDYYSFNHTENVVFIDRRCRLNEVLSCLLANNPRYGYRVKYELSSREKEVLVCLQEGLSVSEISQQLQITIKTLYTHQRNLIKKLQVGNRISLYKNILMKALKV